MKYAVWYSQFFVMLIVWRFLRNIFQEDEDADGGQK